MKNNIVRLLAIFVLLIGVLFTGELLIKKAYPLYHFEYIEKYSKQYKLDFYLVSAVIKAESNFKINAKSHKDAHGLMQITEDTAKWIAGQMKMTDFEVQDLYKPDINIKMGCWYLDNLRQEFKGNLELMLASYNAGRGNVNSWLQDSKYSKDGETLEYIPFKETDKYIKRVKVNYNIYKHFYPKK
jgi:soluble lytic murein transglycosylase